LHFRPPAFSKKPWQLYKLRFLGVPPFPGATSSWSTMPWDMAP
jgi:hypothetical protein